VYDFQAVRQFYAAGSEAQAAVDESFSNQIGPHYVVADYRPEYLEAREAWAEEGKRRGYLKEGCDDYLGWVLNDQDEEYMAWHDESQEDYMARTAAARAKVAEYASRIQGYEDL